MFHQLGVEIPKLRKSSLVGHKKIVEEKFFTRAFFRHLWRYAFFLSDFTFHHIFHIFQIKYGLFFHTKHENGWKCNEWSITQKWEWAKKARKTSMTLCAFFTSISCVKDLFLHPKTGVVSRSPYYICKMWKVWCGNCSYIVVRWV